MSEELENLDDFDLVKSELEEIVTRAQAQVLPLLTPVNRVIEDIKQQVVHGTDRITTAQIQEWRTVLSIITSELTPHKEAYALASGLWKIQINKSKAKTLAERRVEQKKAELEAGIVVSNSDKETQKIIIDYMANRINGAKEDIYQMCSILNRILDARIANNEDKGAN